MHYGVEDAAFARRTKGERDFLHCHSMSSTQFGVSYYIRLFGSAITSAVKDVFLHRLDF